MASEPARTSRSPRLRWWGVVLVVVATLVTANAAAAVIGPNIPRTAGSEERMFVKADQIYGRSGPADVVFLGSSETAGGIIPSKVLDETPELEGGYNAALAGTYLELTRDWADRVVLPQLDPKIVVISVLGLPGSETDTEVVKVNVGAQKAYRSALDQIDPGGLGSLSWELRQRSALIRYRPLLRNPNLLWQGITNTLGSDDGPADPIRPMDFATETDPARVRALTESNGEVLDYRDPGQPGSEDVVAKVTLEALGQAKPDFAPLERLVETIRAHGAVPVLTLAPINREAFAAEDANLGNFDDRTTDVEAWAKAKGIPVHSVAQETWPSDWFHDRFHVAEKGADAWSQDLGSWLHDECAAGELRPAC
jgi:hypothetical protein